MPHLEAPLHLVTDGALVSPIPGNTGSGGACYAGDGQALYAVNVGGEIQVWRTHSGLDKLWLEDGSVNYLATIATGPFDDPIAVGLTRIDGTVYANLSARRPAGAGAGQWIYRDTSAAADGSGPWALHGTITSIPSYDTSGNNGRHFGSGGFLGGEILVTGNGTWVTNVAVFGNLTGGGLGFSISQPGVATSGDRGVTWTIRMQVGDTNYSLWSRNFGQFAGAWYVGGANNKGFDFGYTYKSTDLVSWVDLGSLGQAITGDCYTYPASASGVIYRWAPSGGLVQSPRLLEVAASPPETMPAWETLALPAIPTYKPGEGQFVMPLLCQVGPSARPAWAVTSFGKVAAITYTIGMPPCRLYPRDDRLGTSSAARIYPPPISEQGSNRRFGYY